MKVKALPTDFKGRPQSLKSFSTENMSTYDAKRHLMRSALAAMGDTSSRVQKPKQRLASKLSSLDEGKLLPRGAHLARKEGQFFGGESPEINSSRWSFSKGENSVLKRSASVNSGSTVSRIKLPRIPEIRIEDIPGRNVSREERNSSVGTLTDSGMQKDVSLESFEKGSSESSSRDVSELELPASQDGKKRPLGKLEVNSNAKKREMKRLLKRKMLGNKWKRVVRFFCVLYRTWKMHSSRVTDILEQFDSLDMLMNQKDQKQDLLFDLSDYKAHKEARITQEAKRVLMMTPGTRSEGELHCIRVALRNYPSMMEYPVRMQRLMAERAWYERYDSKRVILREGHNPLNFYFILSGSVLVSRYDHEKRANKTVCFLGRGDSFGESAILDKVPRDCTVISKENLELFCLSDDDYNDIFMSGGLNNPADPFLKGISCLVGWPRELLAGNPKVATLAFYKRKTILEMDSTQSDWIFIIKSGSANVMKKLRHVDPVGSKQARKKKKRPDPDEGLSHEEVLARRFEVAAARAGGQQTPLSALINAPEINIATRPTYRGKKAADLTTAGASSTPVEEPLADLHAQSMSPGAFSLPETPLHTRAIPMARAYEDLFLDDPVPSRATDRPISSPFLTKTGMPRNPPVSITVTNDERPPRSLSLINAQGHHSSGLPSLAETNEDPRPETAEERLSREVANQLEEDETPMFVVVQTLIKGSVFGLADIVYGSQPVFSLVSNGAEIIKISKRFYTDHADQRVMTRNREEIYPYPTDEDLQDMLQTCVDWDYNRTHCLHSTLHKLHLQNANLHDARVRLNGGRPVLPSIT